MLKEMQAKGERSMAAEQKTFAAYSEWVDDESKKLAFEIQTGAKLIEELIASISKLESDAAALGRAIAALDSEINTMSGELNDAVSIRRSEHAQYLKMSKDYGESVDALTHALQVMSAENYDRPEAEMLLQRMSNKVPGMTRVLAALSQERGRGALRGDGAPDVAAYEFQSGGIVGLLENLSQKFKSELAGVEEAESNQAHEHALTTQHLKHGIQKREADRDVKTANKAQKLEAAAKAKGELAETKAEKAADEQLKIEIETTHRAKSATYAENQKVRTDELEAIKKATEIISSPDVSSSYSKHVNTEFSQVGRPTSLLQVVRSRHRSSSKAQAAAFLRERAVALNSDSLSSAAAHAAADPFAKVIGMIESLLERLKEEAAAESDHKAWCDEQLKKNKLKRNRKTNEANQLVATIDGQTAGIADHAATIDTLVEEQAALTKAIQEMTAQRQKEHDENVATIADASAGIDAVGRAIVILKEFYAGQASLIQQGQVPEMAAYKGMQSSKGGVVGMLEVILTDFSRLKTETEASERTSADEYDAFMKKSQAANKEKHEAEVQQRLDKDQLEFEKSQSAKDLKSTEEELGKANEYYGYLKPNCVHVHVSYEERAARRKEEIEALKQAYSILDQKGSA